MRESFGNAIKSNAGAIILGAPFVAWLFLSLFVGNAQLRNRLEDQQRYYERRLAEDEAANRSKHTLSFDDRKRLEGDAERDRKRLGVIESRLKAIEMELSR